MKKRTFLYNLINIIVLLLAVGIFALSYVISGMATSFTISTLVVITVTVVLVHFLKAFRLYLALYGSDISLSTYAKTYCKVTPVSILLPFKLGELFRMYCYGYTTGNMLKGIVTVILDRFVDTVALVTMIIVVWIANGGLMMPIVYILAVFIAVAALLFFAFPGLYTYWKKFLLRANATPRKLRALRYLESFNRVYQEILTVTKGRGIILYILSLLAWSIEMGSVAIFGGDLSDYLTSALSDSQSYELKQFIFISVILLIVIYLFVKAIDTLKTERN